MTRGIPVPQADFSLHLTATECSLFHTIRSRSAPHRRFGFQTYCNWRIPKVAARYLSLCDGRTTHEQIAAALGENLNSFFGEILADQAVRCLEETKVLQFNETPVPGPLAFRVTGAFDSYLPLHISFEITDTCNFRCDHCYVSASPEKHGRKNGKETIVMLRQLADAGVRVVELTGGECTTHPEFKDILHFASENFHLVAVISNGFLLGRRTDLADFVADRRNVVVQISLDGLGEFHDRFRQMPGAFDAACEAMRRLKARGVVVRMAMSVTEQNLDQALGVFHLARELQVDALSLAAVTSFGRGQAIAGCSQTETEVAAQLNEILRPYYDDPLFDAVKRERQSLVQDKAINCGAGWRSFALNSDGSVRSCLYLVESKRFGNMDQEGVRNLFRHKEMSMFHDAPSPGGPECTGPQPNGRHGCEYVKECLGCFAKAFRVSETVYPECPWRAKHFPGMSLSAAQAQQIVPLQALLATAGSGAPRSR